MARFSLENCHLQESTERPLITKGVSGVEGVQVSKRAMQESERKKLLEVLVDRKENRGSKGELGR